MAADGSVIIDTRMDTTGVQNGVSAIKQSFNGLGSVVKKIGILIGGAFAIGKLTQFGKECVELGSNLAEVQNVVDVTFTTMSDKVNEFAKNAMTSAGLSETMAKQYVGTFGAMSKSFGFSEAQAYDMSTALTQLTGDVASFYNISQDLAYIKLKSVFTGETETLKDLGVVMTQSALDQYALANGYGKTTSAMTEQEKVALRLAFVQKQLSAASGDFIRTSDSWANQVRVMQLQLQSLKATVGQGLINLFTPVLKVINILLGKLATLANAFKSFTELITGKKSSGQTGASGAGLAGTDAIADTADQYGEAADNAEKLADATNDTADATKKATKAAKGYLSPLDEINNYSTDKSADSSSKVPGATGGLADQMKDAVQNVDYGKMAEGETVLDKMSKPLKKIIDRFKQLAKLVAKGFWDGLGDYEPIFDGIKKDLDSIWKSLKDIFTDSEVTKAANNFFDSFAYAIGQVAGSFARIGLTIAQNIIGGIEKFLKQNTQRIKNYLIDMFNIGAEISQIVGNLAVAFADVFSVFGGETAQQITADLIGIFAEIGMVLTETAAKLGRDILNMIAQPFIDNKDILKSAIEGSLGVIETVTSGVLTVVQNLSDAISRLYDEHVKPFFDSIADGLSSILETLITGYNTYILPVLQGLAEQIKGLLEGPLGDAILKIEAFLGKLIDSLKLLWESVLVPLINWIIANLLPVVAEIIDVVGTVAIKVIKSLIKIIGDVADTLSGIIDFLVGVFTGNWELAWQGIKEIADGIWNLIKDIITGTWDVIKTVTKGALKIIKTVISTAWNAIKTATSTVWNAIKKTLSNLWSALKATANTVFNAIKNKVTGVWDSVKNKTSQVWESVTTFVSDKVEAIKTAITDKFNAARDAVKSAFEGIVDFIKRPINQAINIVNNAIGVINNAIGGIESAFSFGPWNVPTPFGTKRIGFHATFPRVGTIPYLASGAVIPPRSEFLAVLGDQKKGNNLETPESLLRQIVREESGKGQGNGNTYNVTVNASGRKLLDIIIDEAELRRRRNGGQNPFLLGGV
jgi:phage-related protein|nr:MAG TPA: minor tail protein [Caudoviricetes sp.]